MPPWGPILRGAALLDVTVSTSAAPGPTQPGVLPLRPLTTGELLDAAVALLRTRVGWLLGAGLLVALGEQAVLFPLRRAADLDQRYLAATGRLPEFWTLFAVGFLTEALIVAVLGGVAATAAPRALVGSAAPRALLGRALVGSAAPRQRARSVLLPVAVTSTLAALACAACWASLPAYRFLGAPALFGLVAVLAWPFVYGLVGLAVPAVVIDGCGPVRGLWRSVRLARRGGLRAVWIRLLGNLVWLLIRVAFGLGAVTLLSLVWSPQNTTWDNVLTGCAFLLVNTLAYPTLACLDAVLHLETRMRTEGLDITLRRALARGVTTEPALAAP